MLNYQETPDNKSEVNFNYYHYHKIAPNLTKELSQAVFTVCSKTSLKNYKLSILSNI